VIPRLEERRLCKSKQPKLSFESLLQIGPIVNSMTYVDTDGLRREPYFTDSTRDIQPQTDSLCFEALGVVTASTVLIKDAAVRLPLKSKIR
jgi:hypothetical protein